jgi:hypothetical protein
MRLPGCAATSASSPKMSPASTIRSPQVSQMKLRAIYFAVEGCRLGGKVYALRSGRVGRRKPYISEGGDYKFQSAPSARRGDRCQRICNDAAALFQSAAPAREGDVAEERGLPARSRQGSSHPLL